MKNNIIKLLLLVNVFLLNACSSSKKSDIIVNDTKRLPKYSGHYKVGKPYVIQDVKYIPKKDHTYDEVGIASWYGGEDGFNGKKTANGDTYVKGDITAAHRTLALPSMVKITNLQNNRSLVVMINDRGPFSKKRIIDVSERAAELLHMKHTGSTKVRVQFLPLETKKLLAHLSLPEIEGAKAKFPTNISIGKFLEAHNNKHGIEVKKSILLADELFADNLLKNNSKNLYVQVGIYKSKLNAEKTARELNKFGKHNITVIPSSKDKLHKLSFGPLNKKNAKILIAHLNNMGSKDIKLLASK